MHWLSGRGHRGTITGVFDVYIKNTARRTFCQVAVGACQLTAVNTQDARWPGEVSLHAHKSGAIGPAGCAVTWICRWNDRIEQTSTDEESKAMGAAC